MPEPIFTAELVHPSNIKRLRRSKLPVKMLGDNKKNLALGTWIVSMTIPMEHPAMDNSTLFLHETWNIPAWQFDKKFEVVRRSGDHQTHAIVVQK